MAVGANINAARNILLYTLLIDDVDADRTRIWNIYYHFMLDKESLQLLQKQAQKLAGLATSIENWRRQPYGGMLRFCDQNTFDRVVKLWKWYALDVSDGIAFQKQQCHLWIELKKACECHQQLLANSGSSSIDRAASPCSDLLTEDKMSYLQHYWKFGVIYHDERLLAMLDYYNPTFSSVDGGSVISPATEPLQSFHLATAYARLTKDSPINPKTNRTNQAADLSPQAQAAVRQFQAWAESLRRLKGRRTVRFTASDAMAFCYVLQHHAVHHDSNGAFQYRDRSCYEQLVLDPVEYCAGKYGTTTFDVIDTSNLVDHWGSLNILGACRPLLRAGMNSTLYMELLQLRHDSLEAYAQGLLCGDIVTVSLLFGLSPIQYWTNETGFSPYPETIQHWHARKYGRGQARFITIWKNVEMDGGNFDPHQLAHFVHRMYLQMFEHESRKVQSSKTAIQLMRRKYPHYTRAGLAVILSLIKNAKFVDFTAFVERLRSRLWNESSRDEMSSQYLQSLDLYLHEFQLCTSAMYSDKIENAGNRELTLLRSWPDIPSTVYLTVAVSHWRSDISAVSSSMSGFWPLLQLSLRCQNTDRESHFPDVQIGLGVVRTKGKRNTASYAVEIQTDLEAREGLTSLVVSALVPTRMLLEVSNFSTVVAVQFMATAHRDDQERAAKAGAAINDTLLNDRERVGSLKHEDVFITQNPPNMKGRMPPPPVTASSVWRETVRVAHTAGKVTFHMIFDKEATRVEKLNLHIDLSSTSAEPLLQSKANVNFKRLSSFVLELTIRSGLLAYRERIRLPVALDTSNSRTRVARRSAYVEFIATVATPDVLSKHPDSLYPMPLACGKPTLENLRYIHLEHLPTIDVSDASKLEWMTPHLMSMMSPREIDIAIRCGHPNAKTDDLRYNFKRTVAKVFAHYTGLGGKKQQNAFGLMRRGETIPLIVVFISALRLDLASLNVTLDAAMLPSTTQLGARERLELVIRMQNNGPVFEVDDDELALWKYAAAAFAERCRDWEHTERCEYSSSNTSTVPAPSFDGAVVCSCGLGRFPQGYKPDVPVWTSIAKHCVRVAISPCYAVPLVEKIFDDETTEQENEQTADLVTKADLYTKRQGCWGCNEHVSEHQKLLKCGGCKVARYCSKECQVKDWKQGQHKVVCKAIKLRV
ncbi:uncharacterized protein Z520_08966 [Fonsecaea multimorphosa CBS 102226]|uniref:MYND-type domain-containing protein n=1 Tax=Fonsecaea multimorphosa CBS 102226 TaxID=1442371 RepID=A0A0D2JY46_9EURO|nr:uncharacterized protein Z520_08966 [Fonsecaea multimorphosa CBS 102226]KIX95449.1 hypothetical protein Z520_08966 [Fonsecaea multimorphosa CBS 102226]OAL20981.1 hypothetical protein AYO22_08401 [Fonsecaea multimorphosa]